MGLGSFGSFVWRRRLGGGLGRGGGSWQGVAAGEAFLWFMVSAGSENWGGSRCAFECGSRTRLHCSRAREQGFRRKLLKTD